MSDVAVRFKALTVQPNASPVPSSTGGVDAIHPAHRMSGIQAFEGIEVVSSNQYAGVTTEKNKS